MWIGRLFDNLKEKKVYMYIFHTQYCVMVIYAYFRRCPLSMWKKNTPSKLTIQAEKENCETIALKNMKYSDKNIQGNICQLDSLF